MKTVTSTLFSILLAINFGQSQSLTVDETINYINKLSIEFPNEGKYYDVISISKEGYIKLESYKVAGNESWNNKPSLRYTQRFHHSDVDLPKVSIDESIGWVVIPCKKDEDCMACEGASYLSPKVAHASAIDSYTEKKLLNAWSYLLSLLAESTQYKRDDTNDPFSPVNFNNSVTGNTPLVKVPLSEENGVFTLFAQIGNTRLKFIFDSGASETSISAQAERQLIDNKVIQKSDYLKPGLYRIADGSIIAARRVRISKMKIGDYFVSNISVSIGTTDSPLLLGRNVLDKFKKWSVDNGTSHLILEKY